jgi:hypothetical protein
MRRSSRVGLALGVAAVIVILGGVAATVTVSATEPSLAAAAAKAPAVQQCNPPSFPTGKAYEVTCKVTIENTITPEGATNSRVTTTACLAAAGVPYPSCPLNHGPITTVTSSAKLVTSVNQCNGIAKGGGSNVICNVTVTNNIVVGTPTAGVTVNQCIGSGTGGGSTVSCAPLGDTTSATVTQCNGSSTGGGTYAGQAAVKCNVTGAATALPLKVNQCNGTATGGGSAVTCTTAFSNNFLSAATTTTTSPATTTTSPTGTTTSPTGTTSPTATSTPIPTGPPQTGAGGASHSGVNGFLVVLGGLALAGAGAAMAQAVRRRRLLPARSEPSGDE